MEKSFEKGEKKTHKPLLESTADAVYVEEGFS